MTLLLYNALREGLRAQICSERQGGFHKTPRCDIEERRAAIDAVELKSISLAQLNSVHAFVETKYFFHFRNCPGLHGFRVGMVAYPVCAPQAV
jgi:hypothetical protein